MIRGKKQPAPAEETLIKDGDDDSVLPAFEKGESGTHSPLSGQEDIAAPKVLHRGYAAQGNGDGGFYS